MQTTTPSPGAPQRWRATSHLGIEVAEPSTIVLQVAPVAAAGLEVTEDLRVVLDGRPLPVRRIRGDHGGAVDIVQSPPGSLAIDLDATVVGLPGSGPDPGAGGGAGEPAGLDLEQLTYLRQSRYCPSDRFSGFAAYELGHLAPGPELLAAVCDWVGSRLTYEVGASGPLDTAVDSFFTGRGVCRDFGHLAITVLRALEVPARLVAAYAPGLAPMDFHAVVEAYVGGRWWALDPTRLAPRPTLLRIATGRDAADTAFLTTLAGQATLVETEVVAFTEGVLPLDDHLGPVHLPDVP